MPRWAVSARFWPRAWPEALNIARIHLPHAPAAAGALGLAAARTRTEATAHPDIALPDLSDGALADIIDNLSLPRSRCTVTMAARAQMHPLRLRLSAPPSSARSLASALEGAYRSRFGIAPPGPGHLFSLTLCQDGAAPPSPPPPHVSPTPPVTDTPAGRILTPDGWTLRATETGYLMERK